MEYINFSHDKTDEKKTSDKTSEKRKEN